MELHSSRITLRPARLEDADALFALAQDPLLTENLSWSPHTNLQETTSFLESIKGTPNHFVVVFEGKPIGSTALRLNEAHKTGEFGTWIGRPYWGLGLNRELKTLLLDYAFDQLRLNRVQALTRPTNLRSQKSLEALGFTREALLRNYYVWKDTIWDMYVYSILPQDWINAKAQGIKRP